MTEIGFFEGEGKDRFFFALGRNAIYAAFLSAGLKAGDKVLTPAFDCDGTLQPFKALGLEPVFYRSDPYTFQVDIADIVEKLSAGPKMVHVINHFGFPQPWDELLALRKKIGIPILEDNAYSLFSSYKGKFFGSFGDFAIFSLKKNLPLTDGGMLVVNNKHKIEPLKKAPLFYPCDYANVLTMIKRMLGYYKAPEALVYFAGFTSIFFTLSLLWQGGLQHSALESGLLTLPFAIGTAIFSSQSSKWAAKLGRTVLIIGAIAVAVGLGVTWVILQNVSILDLNSWILLPGLFLAGAGNGCFLAPNVQFIVATVENSEAGSASGVVQTMQRLGTAIGVAVVGSILFNAIHIAPQQNMALFQAQFKTGASNGMLMSFILAVAAVGLVFSLPKRVQQHGGAPAPVASE